MSPIVNLGPAKRVRKSCDNFFEYITSWRFINFSNLLTVICETLHSVAQQPRSVYFRHTFIYFKNALVIVKMIKFFTFY